MLPAAVLLAAGAVHGLLLTQTPAFGFDEGVYVTRALVFAETGRLYSTGFWDHPFVGWASLGLAFRAMGFPAIVLGDGTAPPSFQALWVVPRALMVLLGLASAVLVYRIALLLQASRRQAIFAMAIFALTSLSAFYRMVFIDNIGNAFLLAAVLLALESKVRGRRYLLLSLSGATFGLALLTKLSFIAFLPVFMVLIIWGVRWKSPARGAIRSIAGTLALFVGVAAGVASLWLAYAWSVGGVGALIATQQWQLARTGGWPFWGLLGFFVFRDPVVAILGFAGVVRVAKRGESVLVTWILSYLVFLAVIGLRYDHYLIPLGAPLSICAAIYVDERIFLLFRRIVQRVPGVAPRVPKRAPVTVAVALVLAVLATVAYQAATIPVTVTPQERAYEVVVGLAPAGSVVVANPAYLCMLQLSRPDLQGVSWFDIPSNLAPGSTVVLVVDQHLRFDMGGLPAIVDLYNRSIRVAGFGDAWDFVEVRRVG